MTKRSKKIQKSPANTQGFVVVAFAKDMEQARDYEILLKTNDIPVVVNENDEHSITANEIAVMVPEDYLDEAHVVIESQDAYDDFYDFALEEEGEDDSDFGAGLFDEEF